MSTADVRLRLVTAVVGFLVAIGLLFLVLSVVGVRETLAAISQADEDVLPLVLAAVALWVVAWTYTLSTVLWTLEIEHGPLEALVLFGHLVFANSIAPSTYLGGEPLAALLIARRTGQDYETGFAAVTSADLLNYAPMVPLAGIGLLYFATTAVVGQRTELTLLAVFTALLALIGGLGVGWYRRERAVVRIAALIGAVSSRTSPFLPGVHPVQPERLEGRLRLFVTHVESVANDRATVKVALAYSTVGWLLLSAALWLALYAVGHTVSPSVVLFAVPLGAVSNVLPLPGGLGTVESILVVLLVAAGGVPAAVAAAATLLYRGTTYWLPLLFGAGTVLMARVVPRSRTR